MVIFPGVVWTSLDSQRSNSDGGFAGRRSTPTAWSFFDQAPTCVQTVDRGLSRRLQFVSQNHRGIQENVWHHLRSGELKNVAIYGVWGTMCVLLESIKTLHYVAQYVFHQL